MIKMPPKGQIFKLKVLESLLASENSCVTLVPCTRLLAVPAFFLNDMKSGIIFLLNKFLKKYDRALNGIPIGYQKVKVLMDENTGIIRMGNAETEVNVSVEFYIFQPKVGSSLLGVINKKSSTHIGCLVHKYFNATILKPENIDCEDWICKDFNVNDTIVFKVKDLDFTGVLPYIEGIIDDENFVRNKNEELDSNKMSIDLKENDFRSATSLSKIQNKKGECNDIQSKTLDRSVNNMSFNEIDSTNSTKKKKKKVKEKRQKSPKGLEEDKLREYVCENVQETENEVVKEKKKKKKKSSNEQEVVDELPSTSTIENVTLADEQTDEHQFGTKRKKKKKDKKKESSLQSDKIEESQNASMVADSIFYSTQLEPSKPLMKPSVPFCSPIPQIASFGREKIQKEDSVNFSNLDTGNEEEKKGKKSKKKRKKNKDESDSELKSKKPSEQVAQKQKESDKSQPTVQDFLSKIFKEQMSRINQQSASDSEKSAKTQSKNVVESESIEKSQKTPGKVDKKKKERDKSHSTVQNILNDIFKEQTMKMKKSESVPGADTEKTNKGLVESKKSSRKSEKKKERDKSQPTIIELFKANAKEGIKHNTVSQKETKTENSAEGLYEKLLKEARHSISADVDLPNTSITGPSESDTKKKKHKSELKTNTQTNEGKLKRKRDTLEKTEGPSTPKKFKNGNMYDYKYEQSPVKINPDKSLFSDSESSTKTSPMKKEKQINGLVNEKKNETSSLEKVLKKLVKEQRKKLESETESVGKSSVKSAKKEKKKKKRKEDAEESLYEKLLKNARSSINLSKDV